MLTVARHNADVYLSEGERRLVCMIIATALKDARRGHSKNAVDAEKWLHSPICYFYIETLLDIGPDSWEWILRERRKEIESRLKNLYNR